MKASDVFQKETTLISEAGDRLARRSGQMVDVTRTTITNPSLGGDEWKTRWSKFQPGDRPTLRDWLLDAPQDFSEDAEAKSQVEMELEHQSDDEEESRRKRLRSEAGHDAEVRVL
jgi:hypothetical protein